MEETIPVAITVWAAGNAPVPFVKELLSQLPASAAGSAGRINVDRWLRCPMPTPETFGSILVLGDIANLETKAKYDASPKSLPQTAQVRWKWSHLFVIVLFERCFLLHIRQHNSLFLILYLATFIIV